jgi:CBS domain-containing protein
VHPEDVIDLAASLMDWEHIRRVPVEDDDGRLVGLLSQRGLLRLVARGGGRPGGAPIAVREVMKADPVTVGPKTSILEAIEIMRTNKVGCLPVVEDGHLVGIVTEHDFIEVSKALLEEKLRES